jgi:hypothetical protein
MGRHSAPEGRHRRNGALLAQAALVAVLALVTVSVLFGSGMARDRMVEGTFAASETAGRESPRVETPETTPERSPATSGPTSMTAAPAPAPRSPDRVNSPERRGATVPPAPMSKESASGSPDTTPATTPTTQPAQKFSDCAEAKAAGVSMIPRTDPRYARKLDRDRDGFACDAHGDPPTPTTTRKTPAATSSTTSTAPSSTTTTAPSMSASTTPTTTSAPPIKPASDVLGS